MSAFPQFDSRPVQLTSVSPVYDPTEEEFYTLRAQITVKVGGELISWRQDFPCAANPTPPGWGWLASLSGVSAHDVVTSWEDEDDNNILNPAAQAVINRLQSSCEGKFRVRSSDDDICLTPVRNDFVDVLPAAPETTTSEEEAEDTHAQMCRVRDVIATSTGLLFDLEGYQPAELTAPTLLQPDPDSWFHIESIFGIRANQVAKDWAEGKDGTPVNPHVARAAQELITRFAALPVPVHADGPDWDTWRARMLATYEITPTIDVPARAADVVIRRVWKLFHDRYHHALFRGPDGGLRIVHNDANGRLVISEVTAQKLEAFLNVSIKFSRSTDKRDLFMAAPKYLPKSILENITSVNLAPIDAITDIPVLRVDFSVHDTPGYDRDSRVWFAPTVTMDPVPEVPTSDDIAQARALLEETVRDFPFINGGYAGFVAMLLDQLTRPVVNGPRPLYVVEAPGYEGQGTGKTLLARTVGTIITGDDSAPQTWNAQDANNIITSLLRSGRLFVLFDNVQERLASASLAALATATTWSGRILHSNDSPVYPNISTWVLTANGAEFDRDLARRVVTIQLKVQSGILPHQRTKFTHPLPSWAKARRTQIIRACLILARSWYVAGKPLPPEDWAFGTYESWMKVIGGILHFHGIDGLPACLQVAKSRDTETQEATTFLATWLEVYASAPVTPSMLAEMCISHGIYQSTFEQARGPSWIGRRMANIINKMVGNEFKGHAIRKSTTKVRGYYHYAMIPLTP